MGANSPGSLSPRQRMINMMYLVLTALLALNVSREILTAFITVNEGLEETNKNFTRKTNLLYNEMDKQYSLDSAKVQKYYNKTQEAKKLTSDMVGYIDHLKNVLVAYTEKKDTTDFKITWETKNDEDTTTMAKNVPVAELGSKDTYDLPTNLLVPDGDSNPKNGYGYKLKKRIDRYKKDMKSLFEEKKARDQLTLGMSTDSVYSRLDGKYLTWQTYNFYHAILAADMVMLNKIVAEIRNAEADVVSKLLSMISVTDFKFDRVEAKVIPKSNYVLQGEKYEADIFVAAVSETQQPDVYVLEGADTASRKKIIQEGKKVDTSYSGMTKYIINPSSLGEKSYTGVVKMRVPGTKDQYNYYPFSSDYIVAQPTAVISATKVNVLYIGVENPVKVSVPGVANSRLGVTASNARISGSRGEYMITPTAGAREVVVSASASKEDGGSRSMGQMKFRVKRLPDPEIKIANRSSGETIRKISLLNQPLIARLDALFDVSYRVVSFKMEVTIGGNTYPKRTNGNKLSPDMKSLVQRLSRGDNVRISNITVAGPDGQRIVDGIYYKIR